MNHRESNTHMHFSDDCSAATGADGRAVVAVPTEADWDHLMAYLATNPESLRKRADAEAAILAGDIGEGYKLAEIRADLLQS